MAVLKQISKRGLEYNKPKTHEAGGVWVENNQGFVTLKTKVFFGKSFESVDITLTLAQAKALRTLMDIEINDIEKGLKNG